jgi:hypothetical protein
VGRIIIAAGNPGTGKSLFGMGVEEPIEFWDIENKNFDLQKEYFNDKLITRKDLLVFDDGFKEDWYATYLSLKSEVDKIISLGQQVRSGTLDYIGFEWLVIDGISPIRNKIMYAKWLHDHSGRKRPNEYEWGAINEYVRELLFPSSTWWLLASYQTCCLPQNSPITMKSLTCTMMLQIKSQRKV